VSTHSYHKDGDHILYDNCPRCEEHAMNPWELDHETFRDLVKMTIEGPSIDTTNNEAIAAGQILIAINRAQRLARAMGSVAFEKRIGTWPS
jgi:hypothetical protein